MTVAPRRPAVSFILFAYNQERFIREAVDGALAQSFEPLEIILSDDCSPDGTFEIMREMAAGYRGPHRVRAVRNEQNLGVTRHVLLRCREAAGDIIVVAAGDDISKPERAARLVDAFGDDETVQAVTTGFDLIDENGGVVQEQVGVTDFLGSRRPANYFRRTRHPYTVIQGSTAAYRREVFDFPFPPEISGWEDQLLTFRIYATGGQVRALDESLVLYREHSGALANNRNVATSPREQEEVTAKWAAASARKLEGFVWVAAKSECPDIDLEAIHADLHRNRAIERWREMGFFARLAAMLASALGRRRSLLTWQARRLFGRFPDYFPQTWRTARR
jgi:glycosyltransferase involved in cell wall biosynthesis